MWIDALKPHHYDALYDVSRRTSPPLPFASKGDFVKLMESAEGFVVVTTEGRVVGTVYFTGYVPGCDVLIHAFVEDEYRGRWLTKAILKEVFDYPFIILSVHRISAYSVPGITAETRAFLEHLGFRQEGVIRQSATDTNGNRHDVILYGMLKEERRF